MKKGLFMSLFMISIITTYAQKRDESKIKFNVGAELGFATGGLLKTAYSIGLGATAQLEYAVDDNLSITANSGIIQYVGRKTTIAGVAAKIRNSATFPILIGGKYNLSDNLYGTLQLGTSIFSGAGQSSRFTYAPGLGFRINDKVDAQVKYTGYASYGGALGVRVSYSL
jgi:hypothetical protein